MFKKELENEIKSNIKVMKTKETIIKEFKENLKTILTTSNIPNCNFGIYKYLNYRNNEIKNFLEKIDGEFSQLNAEDTEKICQNIICFFGKIYKDGFLLPKMPGNIDLSKNDVVFNWSTKNRYYVKTMKLLKEYEESFNNFIFYFKIKNVEQPFNNEREDMYFYIFDNVEVTENKVVFNFIYKKIENIDGKEVDFMKKKNFFDFMLKYNRDKIEIAINNIDTDKKEQLVPILFSVNKKNNKIKLDEMLNKFFKRYVNMDFFIHKNLKDYLQSELRIYLSDLLFNENLNSFSN
jgi:hypothetical protein